MVNFILGQAKNNNMAVVTSFSPGYRRIGGVTVPRMMDMAEQLQLSFYHFAPKISGDHPASWGRIPAIKQLFKTHSSVWYLDADVLLCRDISKFDLENWFLSKDADLVIGRDFEGSHARIQQRNEFGVDVNSGSFFIRNSKWASDFLDQVWQQTDLFGRSYQDQQAFCRVLGRDKSHAIIDERPEYNRWFQAWRIGDATCHFAGAGNQYEAVRNFAASVATVPQNLTDANCESQVRWFVENQLQQYSYPDMFAGRGIVICAGGEKYLRLAYANIRRLRAVGCKLPIQLWYLGLDEYDATFDRAVIPYDVEMVDARRLRDMYGATDWLYSHRRLNGWEVKSYAIMHSPFAEVMLLDADNFPIENPEFLFETPEHKTVGTILWPDREMANHPHARSLLGLPQGSDRDVESGQVVVNKKSAWAALVFSHWMQNHSEYFYSKFHGDKEVFHFAWLRTNTPYAMPPELTICQKPYAFIQHDFTGRDILFHVGPGAAKWERTHTENEYANIAMSYLDEYDAII
jgi:hypothetical protein